MWRRYGDAVYAGLVLFVFTAEALGLTALTWAFVVEDSWVTSDARTLETVVFGAIALTALALMVVTAYTLVYQTYSERREDKRRQDLEVWSQIWTKVLFGRMEAPEHPIPAVGIDAVLDLSEALSGSEGDAVRELIDRYRIVPDLLEVARDRRRFRLARIPMGARRLTHRLQALDGLARAKHPDAFNRLLILATDTNPIVSVMACRALARSAAGMRDDDERRSAGSSLRRLFEKDLVPSGVLEELLLLLEDTAPFLLEEMLTTPPPEAEHMLPIVIDAVGRLQLVSLVDLVSAQITHESAEVRAASLRALGFLGSVPEELAPSVMIALYDEEEIVRIQAARLAYVLPAPVALPELWVMLSDPSWWVRRAAGWAHARLGPKGFDQLKRAAAEHPDRYGRHMAAQVLFDAGQLDAAHTRALRAVS